MTKVRVSGVRSAGRYSVVLSTAFVVAIVGILTAHRAGIDPIDPVAGPCMTAFAVVASILALRCVFNRSLDRRTRYAWGWIAAGFVVLVAAFVSFAVVGDTSSAADFPTLGDYLRMLSAPLVLAGLLWLPGRPGSAGLTGKTALDLAMAVTGGAMLLWYLVLGRVLSSTTQPAHVTAVAAAYPIFDLALITGALIVTRRSAASTRRPATLLAASLVAMVVGDIYLSYQRVDLTTTHYKPWQFLCWLASCYLMAMAAAAQPRTPEAVGPRLSGPVPYLSYVGVGISYTLLLLVAFGQPFFPYGGLAYGALMATVLVSARSILSLRENSRLATTDSLTGLANRSRLHDRLTNALERSTRSGLPVAVLMLDLDGFKSVNDELGHDAGDDMLIAVARRLEECVRVSDTTARLGGDEFAVVLIDTSATQAAEAARRLTSAISTPVTIGGHRLVTRASVGVAVSGPGCESVADLLRSADASMYRVKRAARRHGMAEPAAYGRRSGPAELHGVAPMLHGRTGRDRRTARRGSPSRFVSPPAAPVIPRRRLVRRRGAEQNLPAVHR